MYENSKENSVKCFKMRILSWNINGLRSLKGDLNERLKSLKADIICVQETKVTRKWSNVHTVHTALHQCCM